jgi:hypothetical protein
MLKQSVAMVRYLVAVGRLFGPVVVLARIRAYIVEAFTAVIVYDVAVRIGAQRLPTVSFGECRSARRVAFEARPKGQAAALEPPRSRQAGKSQKGREHVEPLNERIHAAPDFDRTARPPDKQRNTAYAVAGRVAFPVAKVLAKAVPVIR